LARDSTVKADQRLVASINMHEIQGVSVIPIITLTTDSRTPIYSLLSFDSNVENIKFFVNKIRKDYIKKKNTKVACRRMKLRKRVKLKSERNSKNT